MNNPNDAISVPSDGMAGVSAEDPMEAPLFVNDYLPALLARASELISEEFHVVARAHGFSVTEWRVMATLAGGTPMSIGQLAQVTVSKQPTITRLLDRMESNGHVKRMPHDSDRRITLVRITDSGVHKVEHLMVLAREHELRVMEPFGLQRAEELKNTLRQLIALHASPPPETDSSQDTAAAQD
jgi:DNA-binding MarR family transcriptional regulator